MDGGTMAAVFTGVGSILAVFFGFTKWTTESHNKLQEARIKELQVSIDRVEELHEERINNLGKSLAEYAHKNRLLEQQVHDYSRHTTKLERIMAAQGLIIPEFETTQIVGGMS